MKKVKPIHVAALALVVGTGMIGFAHGGVKGMLENMGYALVGLSLGYIFS